MSLSLGRQAAATADYVNGRLAFLKKKPDEGLRWLKRAVGEDSKQFACGRNLTGDIFRQAVKIAESTGNYLETERYFNLLSAGGFAYDFDWDSEGDRRVSHKEYLEGANTYRKSEEFLPINACYSAFNFSMAEGDHNDDVLTEGRKCINTAVTLSSDQSKKYKTIYSQVHALMAASFNDRGVYTEALSHAKDSISLDPKYGYAFFQEAKALESLNRPQECIAAAQQAIIVSDGKFGVFHFQLGNCYFDAENWSSAETSFRTAAETDKDDPAAAYNLGLSLKRQGYGGDATHWFQEALKRNPNSELKAKILSSLR